MRGRVGKRIKTWRETRGLSQLQAATGALLSQSEWQKLESARSRRVSLRTARRLCAFMGGAILVEDLDDGALPEPWAPSEAA